MEKKYFRFHQGINGDDWFVVEHYGDKEIEDIKDPSGGHANKQITSIPSPFARIDLIKSAFKEVVKKVNGNLALDGSTIYHRMVSETLDVAQIFFEKSDICQIVTWDKKNDIQSLMNSADPKHKALGRTLSLYLNKDQGYNFQHPNFDKLFLLDLGVKGQSKIMGGTSPATLFFSTANEFSDIDIWLGRHKAFDPTDFVPFHKRNVNFQKWFWALKNCIPEFPALYPEVDEYLQQCFGILTTDEQKALNQAAAISEWDRPDLYAPLMVGVGVPVQVLGFNLKKSIPQPFKSGFEINSEIQCKGEPPLVLPHGTYAFKTMYASAIWDSTYRVETPVDANGNPVLLINRTLPFDGRKYPFLTMDDLLEPYLVKTIFPIDGDAFFDGNYSTDCEFPTGWYRGYLLPLKKTFFDYFGTDKLKDMLTIHECGNGASVTYVEVKLSIPIQDPNNPVLTYQKIYAYPNAGFMDVPVLLPDGERGIVVERKFNLLLYSKYRAKGVKNYFRLGLLSYTNTLNENSLRLYRAGNISSLKVAGRKRSKSQEGFCSYYYTTEDSNNDFDYIQLNFDTNIKAVCVPRFVDKVIAAGGDKYVFAVDFGTSNTHIEYTKTGNANPTVLTFNDQVVSLSQKGEKAEACLSTYSCPKLCDILPKEFLPYQVGGEFKFPQRTVIASNEVDPNINAKALFDYNILFAYEKRKKLIDAKERTNIKWSDFGSNGSSGGDDAMVAAYIEQLVIMMRNRVIEGGGYLPVTSIRWFYPVSMDSLRRDSLEMKWMSCYTRYFGGNPLKNLIPITESVAPYYYYSAFAGTSGHGNGAATIDIGGGTTDITIFGSTNEGKVEVKNISSFRFAADALFGDGFKTLGCLTNGFIAKYWNSIYTKLSTTSEAKSLFEDMLQVEPDNESGMIKMNAVKDSRDIIALFFSLEKHEEVKKININLSLSELVLHDSNMKILPLIFYSAIVYHTAKMMYALNALIPDYLMLSGTGSKVVNMIMPNASSDMGASFTAFEKFTGTIFEAVYGNNSNNKNIRIVQTTDPKALCCKGGLSGAADAAGIMDDKIAIFVNGKVCRPEVVPETEVKYGDYHYSDMRTDGLKNATIVEVQSFLDLLYDILTKKGFAGTLHVNSLWVEKAKENIAERGLSFLNQGVANKKASDLLPDPKLEEPLFFYPFIGMLNDLGFQIFNATKNDQEQN